MTGWSWVPPPMIEPRGDRFRRRLVIGHTQDPGARFTLDEIDGSSKDEPALNRHGIRAAERIVTRFTRQTERELEQPGLPLGALCQPVHPHPKIGADT